MKLLTLGRRRCEPRRAGLTPYRAIVLVSGIAGFVALVQLVRVLGAAWQAG